MKSKLILIALVAFAKANSQTVTIDYDPGLGTGNVAKTIKALDETISVDSELRDLSSFNVTAATGISGTEKFVFSVNGLTITPNGEYRSGAKTLTFSADIIGKLVEVTKDLGNGATPMVVLSFKFVKLEPQEIKEKVEEETSSRIIPPIGDVLANISNNYAKTKIGFVEKSQASGEELEEENAVHIFLDQNGNNLLGTIPQGIANRQYIVHIIYPGYSDREDIVSYSIRQKTGNFIGSLNFLNSNIQTQLNSSLQAAVTRKEFDMWHEKTFLLGIATDDLTFEVIATTQDEATKKIATGVLQTYTIKMSPVYHGSFDVGLINSELQNPEYSLVAAPDNSGQLVVKERENGNRGVVTVMATFYTSPVILLEKLLEKRTGKHIPSYKLSGRNLLDDHKFYERIYPAVGVSLNNKSFENLFFGLNWELARGLSIFGGGHWGKIRTFDMPGYQAETTVVTQDQFDFYTNEKWDVKWAYGIKLDILIIASLFKG